MSYTTQSMTLAARRSKLRQVQRLVSDLIQINEAADRISTQLTAQSVSAGEIENTLNKLFDSAGPPYVIAETDPSVCVDDTVSGRIINILIPVTGGIGWEHTAS